VSPGPGGRVLSTVDTDRTNPLSQSEDELDVVTDDDVVYPCLLSPVNPQLLKKGWGSGGCHDVCKSKISQKPSKFRPLHPLYPFCQFLYMHPLYHGYNYCYLIHVILSDSVSLPPRYFCLPSFRIKHP
jgi:hypothetical protein